MKKLESPKWMNIVYGILLITFGVVITVISVVNMGLIKEVLSISLAVCFFIIGLLHIITTLVVDTDEIFSPALVSGSAFIAVGVILCINTGLISSFIMYLIGSLLLSLGAVAIIKSILFIKFKQKGSLIAMFFIAAIIFIGLGVLTIIFSTAAERALYISIGVFIFVVGIIETIISIKLISKK